MKGESAHNFLDRLNLNYCIYVVSNRDKNSYSMCFIVIVRFIFLNTNPNLSNMAYHVKKKKISTFIFVPDSTYLAVISQIESLRMDSL